MIHSRGANAGTGELVMTQVLQGMGGGFAAVAIQVGAQASVKHADVAVVTAVVLLVTEIGGAVGTAIGMSWRLDAVSSGALLTVWFSFSGRDLVEHDAEEPREAPAVAHAGRAGHSVREHHVRRRAAVGRPYARGCH